MAFIQLEDFDGNLEIVVFSSVFEQVSAYLQEDAIIFVSGMLDKSNETKPKLIAERILPALEAREKLTKSVHVRLLTDGLEEERLKSLHALASAHPGPCSFLIHVLSSQAQEFVIRAGQLKVCHSKEFLIRLRDVIGHENVWLGRDY